MTKVYPYGGFTFREIAKEKTIVCGGFNGYVTLTDETKVLRVRVWKIPLEKR